MPLRRLADLTLTLPRVLKRIIVLAVDASLCVLTVWLAFYLRLDQWIALSDHSAFRPLIAALGSVALALPVFIVFGLYRSIFRHSGPASLVAVLRAGAVYALLYAAAFTAIGIPGIPRSVGVIQPVLLIIAVAASRALAHAWLGGMYHARLRAAPARRVLIYGAGAAGRQLAAALSGDRDMQVLGFIDDDPKLHGQVLNGRPIHAPEKLVALVSKLEVSDVLLALPSISRRRRNEILDAMLAAQVSVRTLPSLDQLMHGKVHVSDLREPDVDDLLGREPVAPEPALMERNTRGKVVLVTGAGGSIGSELCRQILAAAPRTLVLVERSEFALYGIEQSLSALADGSNLVPVLADVGDARRIDEVLARWKPDTIYHAAAYKHVPLVEANPGEGLRNNALGTHVLARCAMRHGVADFVLISSDKAVRPSSVMGASKRLAEMILQALTADAVAQSRPTTRFSMVRFGNVLGSSGSVVPLFRRQIRSGGPVTVTHPDVTRYFMTTDEAAQLVIQAGAMARGGDVFVLDMGPPVRIVDLARRMIELSGLIVRDAAHPDGDIEITFTGLRPGEKLFEELVLGNETEPTAHPRILRAQEAHPPLAQLEAALDEASRAALNGDAKQVRQTLHALVPEYTPATEHDA